MLTLLHASDLHFGPNHVARVADALLESAAELRPDIVVHTGDFTERARPREFEAAWRYLARLPDVPTAVTPGNRDIALFRAFERFLAPYAWYRRYISPDLDDVLAHEGAVVVSLNTTRPRTAIRNGRVSARQLDLCARAFRSMSEGAARVVVMHHPLMDPRPGRRPAVPRARHVVERLQELEVDLLLCGHGHHAWIGNSLDVHPGRNRDHGIVIANAGTTTSRRGARREREKNSFNLIRIHEGAIHVVHYMYFADLDAFAPASRHVFPRRGHDYLVDLAPGPERSLRASGDVLPLRPRRARGGRD